MKDRNSLKVDRTSSPSDILRFKKRNFKRKGRAKAEFIKVESTSSPSDILAFKKRNFKRKGKAKAVGTI